MPSHGCHCRIHYHDCWYLQQSMAQFFSGLFINFVLLVMVNDAYYIKDAIGVCHKTSELAFSIVENYGVHHPDRGRKLRRW